MKLNEKIVSYYESCQSPVDKEGYLYKKGEIKTSYQKRWFVLKGNLLFYKDRPADRDLTGLIVLEGCTVELCESEEQFAFSLVWAEPGLKTYKFAAEDQPSQESWIKALLSANHNYMSVLVMDLEKKYREAFAEFAGQPVKGNPFVMPVFNNAEAGYPTASLGQPLTPVSSCPTSSVSAVATQSSGLMFQPVNISPKPAAKRSPMLWPKRNANVVPLNDSGPPLVEWPAAFPVIKEEFCKLHEDFGKEVKLLIAKWSKKGRPEVAQEENLIDFG